MATGVQSQVLIHALNRIRERFSGEMGVAARNLNTGETVEIDAERSFPTASVFKVPVMVEVYRQAEWGKLSLDERLTLGLGDLVPGSGVLRDLGPGLQPSIRDLVTLMIIVSDNTATNMLIDRVGGVDAINRTMHEDYGFTSIVVRDRIDFTRIGDDGRRLAEASPRDLLELLTLLAGGRLVSPEASAAMLAILRRQHYLNQVPRYLDYNPYGPELNVPQPLWVGCKTGSLPGVRADAGLIATDDGTVRIAYAVMTERGDDASFGSENESEVAVGAAGRALVAHWWPGTSGASAPLQSSALLERFS